MGTRQEKSHIFYSGSLVQIRVLLLNGQKQALLQQQWTEEDNSIEKDENAVTI